MPQLAPRFDGGRDVGTAIFVAAPFAYFARYAPGMADRAHLQDEQDFLYAAQHGSLPAVSFVKPVGIDNEHPGYTSEPNGSDHLVNLIKAVMSGPQAGNTLILVTYDVATNLTKGLVSYITTSSQQGAYLAGILAARTTKTHKVGIIISASDSNWYKMSGGFAVGFRSVDKSSKIFFATVSPTGYDDAAGGKRVANSVIAQGADAGFHTLAQLRHRQGATSDDVVKRDLE